MNLNRSSKNIFLLIFFMILINCSSVKTLNDYYLISYEPNKKLIEKFNTIKYPLPYKIQVEDLDINRIYDRNSIVTRESLHKLSFDSKNKWALRPNKAIVEQLINHILKAEIFQDCKNDYLDANPDYYITGRLNNIEKYKSQDFNFAHINMDLFLRDKNRNILVKYKINQRVDMKTDNTSFLVKTLSDILKKEFSHFINEISLYFKKQVQEK